MDHRARSAEGPPGFLKHFVVQLIVGTIGGFVCSLPVLFVGMVIGGNLAPNFEFAGNRGYEATGGIGMLIGIIVAAPTLVYTVGRRRGGTGTYGTTLAGGVLAAVLVGVAILLSPQLRLPDSVFPLSAFTALGATVGSNISRQRLRVVSYAGIGSMLVVAAWGYTLERAQMAPALTFTGDLHGGSILSLNAVGADGSTASTTSALPPGEVVQDGPGPAQYQFSRCIPMPAGQAMPVVVVHGQQFRPGEAIQIEAHYTAVDCSSTFLTGTTQADAQGTFSTTLTPDAELNAPPPTR